MPRCVVLFLAASLLCACAGPHQPQTAPAGYQPAAATSPEVLRPCDDGGSHGGVLIDGVCL